MERSQSKIFVFFVCVSFSLIFVSLATGRENPPPPDPTFSVKFPIAAVEVFPNGAKLLLIERRSVPLVTVAVAFRAGAADDPIGLGGVAQLVAQLMDKGTESRQAEEIAEFLDQMGGFIQKKADWDESVIGITVLSGYLEQVLELLSDLVINPAFRNKEIELQRQRTLSGLKIASRDPSYLADVVFNQILFRGGRYGHPPDGTQASVSRISEDSLRHFHRRHYHPSNAIIILGGDFQSGQGRGLIEKYFGSWSQKENTEKSRGLQETSSERVLSSDRRIIVVDVPDAVQTEIRIGNLAPPRASLDYAALAMSNEIFGGTAPDRLFEALRRRKGLVYGVSGQLDARRTAGAWRIETATGTNGTLKTLQIILAEMKRMATRRVSQSEIELARSYRRGNMVLQFESAEDVSSKLLELVLYGLPPDYWNGFYDALGRLGRDELFKVTRRWLRPDQSLVVLVGDAGAFNDGLDKYGKVEVVRVEDLDLD